MAYSNEALLSSDVIHNDHAVSFAEELLRNAVVPGWQSYGYRISHYPLKTFIMVTVSHIARKATLTSPAQQYPIAA